MSQKLGEWSKKHEAIAAVGKLRPLIIEAVRTMAQPTDQVTVELESKETKL